MNGSRKYLLKKERPQYVKKTLRTFFLLFSAVFESFVNVYFYECFLVIGLFMNEKKVPYKKTLQIILMVAYSFGDVTDIQKDKSGN